MKMRVSMISVAVTQTMEVDLGVETDISAGRLPFGSCKNGSSLREVGTEL